MLDIGSPPEPIVSRWGTWLKASMYYCDHLPDVRRIVNEFTGDGLLVRNVRSAINCETLTNNLVTIKRCYSPLIDLLQKSESTAYTIKRANEDFNNLCFAEDPCNLKEYLIKKIEKCDIPSIIACSRHDISPSCYTKLQNAQATSAAVERSFSIQKKILTNGRNFLPENVGKYLMLCMNLR